MRTTIPLILLLAACSGGNSDQDALREAANQSTPEAARVLNGAAENGMDVNAAVNEAAEAQAASTSGSAQPPQQARPNTAEQPNPAQPGQPPDKINANRM